VSTYLIESVIDAANGITFSILSGAKLLDGRSSNSFELAFKMSDNGPSKWNARHYKYKLAKSNLDIRVVFVSNKKENP